MSKTRTVVPALDPHWFVRVYRRTRRRTIPEGGPTPVVIPLDQRRSVYQEGKLVRKPTGYEQKKLKLRRPAAARAGLPAAIRVLKGPTDSSDEAKKGARSCRRTYQFVG